MILLLFHDRRSLSDVACLKATLEECYGPYGLKVQESGYLYVPLQGPDLNAATLLKHLGRMASSFGGKKALWIVDSQLFYPKVGPVFGCSGNNCALLFVGLGKEQLAKEALHEVGHLMGLEHCRHSCVMSLADSPRKVKNKSMGLCPICASKLMPRTENGWGMEREKIKIPSSRLPHWSGSAADKPLDPHW